jgi:molybdopterin molybdotransferase
MNPTSSDCCADPGQELLSVAQGRARILAAVSTIAGVEQLHLRAALHRVLREPVISSTDVPPFANSAMDGYAVRSQDCPAAAAVTLTVIGACFAGAPFPGRLDAGQCVRIMTGAAVPEGADAVIMQEHVSHDSDQIRFESRTVKPGQNVRYAGEDSRRGDTVLHPGQRLGPAELGLLASTGVAEVRVSRRLRVAYFSTGDELVSLGTTLESGQIYDSNRYILSALLSRGDIESHDLGVVPDDRSAVRTAFHEAGEFADLVLTSGGVSVGEADYVTDTLAELGRVDLWRMAMKPGKPLAFGQLGKAVFFGLPGNPVSVMATFYQFVLPSIAKMTGARPRDPLLIQARTRQAVKKAPGRMEFQRGVLTPGSDGVWQVSSTGMQGSHMLSSMSAANCFILLPPESSGAAAGELVSVQPFLDFCT